MSQQTSLMSVKTGYGDHDYADGSVYSSVSESMEGYIARSTGDLAVLCEAIMKFATGAYNYFHP